LPPEARSELEGSPPSPTYRPAQKPPPPVCPSPPPVSPVGSSVTPRAVRPTQSESGSGSARWWLLALLLGLPVLLAMFSPRRTADAQSDAQPSQSRPVEVSQAPPPPVAVRRALPVVPRAMLVTSAVSPVSH